MNDRTDRENRIVRLLRKRYPKSYTYKELGRAIQDELGDHRPPSHQTLARDFLSLEEQGYDIRRIEKSGIATQFSMKPGQETEELRISDFQLLTLSLAGEMLHGLRGTALWNAFSEFWYEAINAAPQETQRHFERKRRHVIVRGVPAKSYSEKGGIFGTIFEAQLTHRELHMLYQKPGQQPTSRIIRPYAIAFYNGSIYTVAEDADKDPTSRESGTSDPFEQMRTFKLDRIVKVDRRDKYFRRKDEFDPQLFFENSLSVFGRSTGRAKPKRITARIHSPIAAGLLAESPIHPDQKIATNRRDETILTIPEIYESEFIRVIMPYQAELEILTPKSCRRQMKETVDQMAARYA